MRCKCTLEFLYINKFTMGIKGILHIGSVLTAISLASCSKERTISGEVGDAIDGTRDETAILLRRIREGKCPLARQMRVDGRIIPSGVSPRDGHELPFEIFCGEGDQ